MKDLKALKVKTILGDFFIHQRGSAIFSISKKLDKNAVIEKTELLESAAKQLNLYLEGKFKQFYIPCLDYESKFLNDVYSALLKVPYGKTISYKELANKAKRPNAYRAVGTAMAKNRLPFIIPCHRVIKNDGILGNYGFGLKIKSQLIKAEAKRK
jgi:methylated-DNA-[protein]-cysteine S-methyltransferase